MATASTFRIHCREYDDFSLAIVDGEPVLAKADPRDERQLWYKDMEYGAGLTDEAGSPSFALVNKATGAALRHFSSGHYSPVRSIKFDPLYVDESVLWAESSEDLGDGFRRIHMVNNMEYILHANRGTRVILFRWTRGKNQQWRIAPLSVPATPEESELPGHARPVRILCQSGPGLNLTIRDDTAVLARADDTDQRQCWVQSFRNTGRVTDDEGSLAFALVNWATGKALRYCTRDKLLGLGVHKPDSVDVALLWTKSEDLGEGFHGLRSVSEVGLVLDAANGGPESGGAHDGTPIIVFPWHDGLNQKWKMLPFY